MSSVKIVEEPMSDSCDKQFLYTQKCSKIIESIEKLRKNTISMLEKLDELEKLMYLRAMCPEFCTGDRGISYAWHSIGTSLFSGPWEFTVFSKGERRTFKQSAVPKIFWRKEQLQYDKLMNKNKSVTKGECDDSTR